MLWNIFLLREFAQECHRKINQGVARMGGGSFYGYEKGAFILLPKRMGEILISGVDKTEQNEPIKNSRVGLRIKLPDHENTRHFEQVTRPIHFLWVGRIRAVKKIIDFNLKIFLKHSL